MTNKNYWVKLYSLIALVMLSPAAAHAQQTQVFVVRANDALWHFDGARWDPRGGRVSSPDACSWGPERLDVFARGVGNNHLMQIWRVNGAWSEWYDHGGELTSGPTCVSWGPNRIDVFARGADGTLIHKAWNSEAWTDWESLGGELPEGATPDAASWGPNRLDVFIRGAEGELLQKAWDGTRWTDWHNLGGQITSDPGAVSWGPNRIDIFARGADGQMVQIAWDGTRWTEWYPQGGSFHADSSPDAASSGVNRLEIYARGEDRAVWRKRWDGSRWSRWERIGGETTLDEPGAVAIRGGGSTPAPAGRGRFRVTITGFRVNRETWDDILHNDGKNDEVFFVSDAALVRRNGSFSEPRGLRGAVVIGDTNNLAGRRRGGRASDKGGFQSGDQHPLGVALDQLPARHNSGGEPPFIAFEGEIVQGESAGLIMPSIWEWDPPTDTYNGYLAFMAVEGQSHFYNNAARLIAPIISAPARSSLSEYVVSATDLGVGENVSIGASPSGEAASRPIGMVWNRQRYRFMPKILVLTYEAAIMATRGGAAGSFGAVRMNYRDDDRLKGDYTIFLVIERLPDGE